MGACRKPGQATRESAGDRRAEGARLPPPSWEFEVDLLRMRTREGMKVYRAIGRASTAA